MIISYVFRTVGNIQQTQNVWDTQFESCRTDETQLESDSHTNDGFTNDSSESTITSQSISAVSQTLTSCTKPQNTKSPQPSCSSHPVSSKSPQHKSNLQEMRQNKRKKSNSEDINKSLVATLATFENVFKCSEDENNEDMLFARSIGESLKLIKNRKMKAKAKLEMLSVIEQYEED